MNCRRKLFSFALPDVGMAWMESRDLAQCADWQSVIWRAPHHSQGRQRALRPGPFAVRAFG